MLVLRVGDPHVQPNNLKESNNLLEFVFNKAIEHKVNRIEILGDLFHTHNQIRLEVLEFWDFWLKKLSEHFETVVLVGNHDQSGSYSSDSHSLSVFSNLKNCNLKIIDKPQLIDIIGYLPYIHNKDKFICEANKLVDQGAKLIVCHQTFDGAQYESGMYAPDGIDISLLKAPLIISGHIHSKQRFKNVIFPGTARWLTISDANEEKGLWLVKHDELGSIKEEYYLDTSNVCTPIIKLKWFEGKEQPALVKNAKNTIELIGTSVWVSKQKALLKNTCAISTKITDTSKVRWKPVKSENNLESFVRKQFSISTGLSRDDLLLYIREELEIA